MSENGAMKGESPEDQVAGGVFDRLFASLAQRHRRKSSPMETAPARQPTAAEIRAAALSKWLADDTCPTMFLPYLDELITNARAMAHEHRTNHAEAVYWLGVEAGLSTLLDEILKIRGQAV